MELAVIEIIVIAFLGPLLVYLTRYVLKGKSAEASRVWFVSFCTYVVYYWLARETLIVTGIEPFYYALLWPIPAILAFWLVEKMREKANAVPYFRWTAGFLVAVLFAFALDGVGGAAGWYHYNASVTATAAVVNPVADMRVPALALIMLGVLMDGVLFITGEAHRFVKKKLGAVTATYILIGLSFIWGGLVWVLSDALIQLIRQLS